MKNKQIDPTLEPRGLYIKLCLLSWISLAVVGIAIIYLLRPGLMQLHSLLFQLFALLIVAGIIGVFFLIALLILVLKTSAKLPMSILRLACGTVYNMLPYCIWWGKLLGIKKERVGQSLVDLVNSISKRYVVNVKAGDVMLLTPHCLQRDACPIKVTRNAFNCRECGQCPVGGLVGLAKKYGTTLYIATGGTFARQIVKKHRPKVIVAIACERDLVLGMRDVFPLLVFGVLNSRPYGPCFNTQVDLNKVEAVLQHLLANGKEDYDSKRTGADYPTRHSAARRIC